MTQPMKLESIKIDGGTQPRAKLDESVVAEYADAIIAGADFPPVVVFHDGKAHWLADGFHRFHAHRKARASEIAADVRTGTKRDAILFSVGANGIHGLRRTNEDKRGAVETLLADKEWAQWSDRDIAKQCNVSHPFVAGLRPVTGNVSSEKPAERTFTSKHGTQATMNTTAIADANKARAQPEPPREPKQPPAADPAALQAEITALRDELIESRQCAIELAHSVEGITFAEQGQDAAAKEIARLLAKLATVESQRDGHMRTITEMQRMVKAATKRADKAERELAAMKVKLT